MQRDRTSLQSHIAPQDQSELSIEEKPHPKNTLNDMSGDRFLYFTKSVLSTSYPSVYSHELRKKHGANKPPQLMALLIEFFTKTGMSVLDPFAGVGGTLIGASIATPGARRCIGIEINQQWTDIYTCVLKDNPGLLPQAMIQGDCIEVMDRLLAHESILDIDGREVGIGEKETIFDFIVMDPPYNIHLEQTMSGNGGKLYAEKYANRRSDYNMRSNHDRDLSNLATYNGYLDAMSEVFQRCYRLVRPGRYMVIIVRNAYQHAEYMFTHVDLARRAASVGFIPKGEIIWYQAGTKLRPYGYPYSFVPNITHQNIVILQRPRSGKSKKTKSSR
jgi:DNA modification methylase